MESTKSSGLDLVTQLTTFVSVMNWVDYLIVASVIIFTMIIIILFGLFSRKPNTAVIYFLGNRQMYVIPIVFSMLSSFVSAVALIQFPEEIYFYGTQCTILILSFVPATFTLTYFFIPVLFNLQLNSAFQYFELRFIRAVRILTSFLGIVSTIGYVTLIVFGTSTVLSKLLGINARLLTMLILLICIASSTSNGLKTVLWTGTFQTLVLLISLTVLITFGASKVMNFSFKMMWERALNSGRIEFFNMDVDPRVRHTFWTSLVGGYFLCISLFGGSQGQIQRFVSVSTLAKAKLAFLLNVCLLTLVILLLLMLCLFSFSNNFDCSHHDQTETITIFDQTFTKSILEVFKNFPGVPGLFVASLLCSTLSSTTNALNSLALTTVQDYFKHWIPNISEQSLIFLSKVLTVTFGCLAFGLVFIVDNVEKFLPEVWSIYIIIISAIFGTFTLGMLFPWANSKGSILGLIASLSFILYGLFLRSNFEIMGKKFPDQKLELPEFNCSNITTTYLSFEYDNPYFPKLYSSTSLHWKNLSSDLFIMNILSISPMWYSGLSWIFTILFGLFFSLFFVKWERNWRVRPDCLSPPILKLLFKYFPSHMKKWIEPDENLILLCSSSFSIMPLGSEDNRFSKEPLCDVKFKPFHIIHPIENY